MTPPPAAAPDPADLTPSGAGPFGPFASWPSMSWSPRAAVFDCDGTLIDTEREWVQTQTAYLDRHGVTLEPEVRRGLTGASAAVVIGALADVTGETPEQVLTSLQAIHAELESEHPAELPGAVDALRAMAQKVPVAIASNSPRALLDRKIDALGLADVVTASIAVEDVENPKPAPDMYARGAELLGAAPEDTLGIEDTETGAAAALAAGLVLIAVPSLEGQRPPAHVTLASLEDPELRAWIDTWPSSSTAPAHPDADQETR